MIWHVKTIFILVSILGSFQELFISFSLAFRSDLVLYLKDPVFVFCCRFHPLFICFISLISANNFKKVSKIMTVLLILQVFLTFDASNFIQFSYFNFFLLIFHIKSSSMGGGGSLKRMYQLFVQKMLLFDFRFLFCSWTVLNLQLVLRFRSNSVNSVF